MKSELVRLFDWGSLILLGLVACALAFLLFDGAVASDQEWWAIFLLACIICCAAFSTWVNRPRGLARTKIIGSRARGAWFAYLALSLLATASFGTDFVQLIAPRPATESAPGAIETGLDEIRARLPARVPAARIRGRIAGVWGNPGCSVSFRFAILGDALVIESEKRPAGTRPYRVVATITKAEADTLEVRGDDFKAATFSYVTNGVDEELVWDDSRDTPPGKYGRCSKRSQ